VAVGALVAVPALVVDAGTDPLRGVLTIRLGSTVLALRANAAAAAQEEVAAGLSASEGIRAADIVRIAGALVRRAAGTAFGQGPDWDAAIHEAGIPSEAVLLGVAGQELIVGVGVAAPDETETRDT
jgi:hypothetical protein